MSQEWGGSLAAYPVRPGSNSCVGCKLWTLWTDSETSNIPAHSPDTSMHKKVKVPVGEFPWHMLVHACTSCRLTAAAINHFACGRSPFYKRFLSGSESQSTLGFLPFSASCNGSPLFVLPRDVPTRTSLHSRVCPRLVGKSRTCHRSECRDRQGDCEGQSLLIDFRCLRSCSCPPLSQVLLTKNAKVWIACRDASRGEAALKELKELTRQDAYLLKLDLANLRSIKQSVEEFLRYWLKICLQLFGQGH